MAIPNIPHPSVPEGFSEDDNLEVLKMGGAQKSLDFEAKGSCGFRRNTSASTLLLPRRFQAARFVVMTGKIAKLQRALTQFMLDHHTEKLMVTPRRMFHI